MMQPFQTLWYRRHINPHRLDPRLLRLLRFLVMLGLVTVVMVAVSITFSSITLALQMFDGILLTLQAVILTLEHGDVFLKAVLLALFLLAALTVAQKQYGTFFHRLMRRLLSH